jgi:hypothetical protein
VVDFTHINGRNRLLYKGNITIVIHQKQSVWVCKVPSTRPVKSNATIKLNASLAYCGNICIWGKNIVISVMVALTFTEQCCAYETILSITINGAASINRARSPEA